MSEVTVESVLEQSDQLSALERLRLIELLTRRLQQDWQQPSAWQQALRATYGIFADDPLERPEQLPLEERDPIE